jgi:hypothetical protein
MNDPTPDQHSKHSRASERKSTKPVEEAKYIIQRLEQRIAEDFGCDVSLGAEIEFVVKSKDGDVPFKMGPLGDYAPQATRSKEQKHKSPDEFFPDSPYVCYSYKELSSPPFYQYESVISHEAIDEKALERAQVKGVLLGKVIEGVMGEIVRASYRPKNSSEEVRHLRDYAHIHRLHDKASVIYMQPFVETFPGSAKQTGLCNGININIGVTEHASGENIIAKTPSKRFAIKQAVKDIELDNLYLLGTDENNGMRFKARNNSQYVAEDFMDEYIENSMPSVSSNPYYAVLLTLAGVYAGLQHAKSQTASTTIAAHLEKQLQPRYIDILPHAEELFNHQDNALRAVLNHLEDGLGDRFIETIQKHPPGTEWRRVYPQTIALETTQPPSMQK